MVPLNCGVCSLCVGLDWWLVKVSWLGELASIFWWVELNFLWSAIKCSVVSFGVSMGLAWLWAAHLVMFRVVFLFAGELVWCILRWNLLALE